MKPKINRLENDFGGGYSIDSITIGKKTFEIWESVVGWENSMKNIERAITKAYNEGFKDGQKPEREKR